ncbi:hypothetical protein ACO0M4_32550 [Streptomyces sp. RGM 3693]|uniref:hypothetical protein n=1 Tax=Streptomyces sp. RGM 3693 TaxID=3413284 RepID=UPI003D2A74DE
MQGPAAGTCGGDAPLGSLAGGSTLAGSGERRDFGGEFPERGVVGGYPFEVVAECLYDLVKLLLKAALPPRVGPTEVLVPVDEPGLQSGDDDAAGATG